VEAPAVRVNSRTARETVLFITNLRIISDTLYLPKGSDPVPQDKRIECKIIEKQEILPD
jgi:hypothetical protein